MALTVVIPTGDFQIHVHWDVLSLSFSKRESGKWPLGLSDFYHNYFISNDCIQHSERYPFATLYIKLYIECCHTQIN